MREVKNRARGAERFAVVSFKSEGDKREVMKKKSVLRGERVWIKDNLTWKES